MISIIVPVYNAGKYLRETLDAITTQTYEDYELLLVDDGSSDDSPSICDKYAEKDSRIKVFHNENMGASAARNFGLDNAQGEYIAFIDSDDIVEKDYLARLYEQFEKENVDVVLCGFDRFYHDDLNDKLDYLLGKDDVTYVPSNKELAMLFTVPKTSLSGVSIWAKLYRRSIIEDNSIRFPRDISYEEDCCFNLLYYRHVRAAVYVKQNLYHYRQLTQSLSKVYKESTFRDLTNGYNKRKEFFAELGFGQDKIKKLDNIYLIVIFNNLKKIAKCKMTPWQRRKAYKKVLAFEEAKYVVNNCGLSKVRMTRYLTLACRRNQITVVALILWAWKIKNKE